MGVDPGVPSPPGPCRLRVLVPALLSLCILLAVGGLTLERIADDRMEHLAEERQILSVDMYKLANILSGLLPRDLVEQAERSVIDASLDSDIELLLVVDETGKVRFSSRREFIGTPAARVPGYDPALTAPLLAGTAAKALDESGNTLRGYFPIQLGLRPGELRASQSGVLFVQYDLSTTLARERAAAVSLALRAGLLWLGCALVLWLLLHSLITRRVERLARVMAAFSGGDTAARAGIAGVDEIARLAQAFDSMAGELDARQEALRLARFTTDHDPDIILWAGADGDIVDANATACRVLGYTRPELLAMRLGDLETGRPAGAWSADWQELRTQGALSFDTGLRTRAGETIEAEVSLNRIDFEGRELTCAFIRDVTERRRIERERERLEHELQHAQKLESLGRLAGGVAHDVNNVLGAVLGLASYLKEVHSADPVLTRDVATIESAALRGRDLVKGLTEFARKELAQVLSFDLNELVEKELALFERTTLRKLEVRRELAPGALQVEGDPAGLSSALMNLWVNAKDAMPEGGQLTVSTRAIPGSRVELAVQDSGHGMTEEVQRQALEPFFTTKPPGEGTGLGLAMVYGTVKAHGGTLEIHSSPGQGTRVVLTLPGTAATPPAAPAEAEPSQPPAHEGLRVLLVDDDDAMRRAIPPLLTFLGFRAETVEGGDAALERLACEPSVDLVILDQNMPGRTGLQLLPELRERHPGLGILLATGLADQDVERALEEYPGVRLITKPFLLDELRQALAPLAREMAEAGRS